MVSSFVAVEGRAPAEGQRRERWRPGGLYAAAAGRIGLWRGGGGPPPLEALRRFCLSWGVLWRPLVERLPPRPPSSLPGGSVFLPTLYQKCGFSCCALQEENVSCGKQKWHTETRVWFLNSESLCSFRRKGLMRFFLFHLLSLKDSNCTIL